ncbi:transposase [Skermanella pratensis]|uniref:transposase n=1 Tax=Skermanella pratensis TaxID=2233999 RepID=UPI0013015E8A
MRPRPRGWTAASSDQIDRHAPDALREQILLERAAENLIKDHKLHLASDRTSCTAATANQFRLLAHTAAYWLLHTLRGRVPKASFWRKAQFDILRAHLIKVAGRVWETAQRIEVALSSNFAYPHSLRRLSARVAWLPP